MSRYISRLSLTLLIVSALPIIITWRVDTAWSGEPIHIRSDCSVEPSDAPIVMGDKITYALDSDIRADADVVIVRGWGGGSVRTSFEPLNGAWSGGTIIIRSDGSVEPSDAPVVTSDMITYALTRDIQSDRDGIIVERSNIILDGAGHKLVGRGSWLRIGIRIEGVEDVTIVNVSIENFVWGVYLGNSSNNIVTNNSVEQNIVGVHLVSSFNNTITNNNVENNNWGIKLYESSNNTASNNNVAGNYYDGVCLYNSPNNTITNNRVENNNRNGVCLYDSFNNNVSYNSFANCGLFVWDSYDNDVKNNTVNGRPLIYLEDVSNMVISSEAGQVILVNCSDIRIVGLNLSSVSVGVALLNTSNTIIRGNILSNNNYAGISLSSSYNNIVSGNNVMGSIVGIILVSSSNNIVSNNRVENNYWGIEFFSSSNNIASNNDAANNIYGVEFISSHNNTVAENNIMNNDYGAYIDYSWNNTIFHNNFINNSVHACVKSGVNTWDNGYPSGGNYWSNYTDTDNYRGLNQDEPGSDGIWDHPYKINDDNVDHYPLVKPFRKGFGLRLWLPYVILSVIVMATIVLAIVVRKRRTRQP